MPRYTFTLNDGSVPKDFEFADHEAAREDAVRLASVTLLEAKREANWQVKVTDVDGAPIVTVGYQIAVH
jgi:hypothetical protein